MKSLIFPVFSALFLAMSSSLFGQVEDLMPGKQLPYLRSGYEGEMAAPGTPGSYYDFVSSFDYSGPKIDVDWECLGPFDIPEERPHQSGIPSYTVDRGNGTGRINFLYLDPFTEGRVFACSPTGGLFVSDDHGLNWRNGGTDQLPISGAASVSVDPKDPDRWFLATGDGDDNFMYSDGLWRTEDGGKSWENINGINDSLSIPVSVLNWKYTRSCMVMSHPKCGKPLFYASNKGLYRSRNGRHAAEFITWEKKLDGWIYDIEVLPWKEKHMIAAGDHIYLSKNYGKSWKQLPDPELMEKDHEFVRINAELSPMDEEYIYAVVTSREKWDNRRIADATLQKYSFKSGEWTIVRNLDQGMNNVIPSRARAFDVSPVNPDLILVGNVQPVYRSEDGGVNFKAIEKRQMHDDIHHLIVEEDGTTVWAAHDGGVSISYDAGLSWENRSNGLAVANVFGVDIAQQEKLQVLYGGYDTGGNLLKNTKWYHVCFGDGFENIIHDEDPEKMITTRQNGGLVKSTDNADFSKKASTSKSKTPWHTWLRSDPFDPDRVFLTGTNLMRSEDFGDNWESILDAEDVNMYWAYKLYPSETHRDVLYAYMLPKEGMGHRVVRTLNASAPAEEVKWEMLEPFPKNKWLSGIQASAERPVECYMSFGIYEKEGKVYRYENGKYIDISYNLGYAIPESMILDRESGTLYIGSSHGVFMLDEEGRRWIQLDGLPGVHIKSLVINYESSKLVAGTFGRGIWQADLHRPKP